MLNQIENLKYKKGETIIREGELGRGAYILESGTVAVHKSLPGGKQQFLGTLVQGDIFGELGLVDGLPRSTTVTALGGCRIRELRQENFDLLVKRNPKILMPILKVLVNRLRQTLRLLDGLKIKQEASEKVSAESL